MKKSGVRLAVDKLLGRRTAEDKWDTQWAENRWDGLSEMHELARYSLLAGYALFLRPGGSILDVGCGAGILRDRLHPDAFRRYVGIDFGEAIARAAARRDERTDFVVGDMRTYEPAERFDVIVFNESLYYAADEIAELRRYAQWLAPAGIFLVSTNRKPKTDALWELLGREFTVVDRVVVGNRRGAEWICGVIDPVSPAG